ncbi:hypothetical protein [Methylobacterium sp. J-076]|uniref:hypothetical protein n=1 Tax=Methylobacterium sp. J-076 TaxID=2836655 RepID=UPI001FBA7534|nr:hypothetical protein [Methylobacterium sp. J-076]MCJ2013582.1 hypothetical protein [Methylobacterium sp. J-076]
MICPRSVEALTAQQGRLTELLRVIDDGRWWAGDAACRIDEDEVCRQAERIGAALDVVQRLTGEMAARGSSGTGSQLAQAPTHATPLRTAAEPG